MSKRIDRSVVQLSTDHLILPPSHISHVEHEPLQVQAGKPFPCAEQVQAQANEHSTCGNLFNTPTDDVGSSVSKYLENESRKAAADDVLPGDSISNVASRASKDRSSVRSRFSISFHLRVQKLRLMLPHSWLVKCC